MTFPFPEWHFPSLHRHWEDRWLWSLQYCNWEKLTYSTSWCDRHSCTKQHVFFFFISQTKSDSSLLFCFHPTIYPSSTVRGAHLDSSSSHPVLSGWLKRDGGVLPGAGMRGIPRAPLQASQAERATAVLQTRPLSFIYFRLNIDACYERFKIMCLPSFSPCPGTLFSNA